MSYDDFEQQLLAVAILAADTLDRVVEANVPRGSRDAAFAGASLRTLRQQLALSASRHVDPPGFRARDGVPGQSLEDFQRTTLPLLDAALVDWLRAARAQLKGEGPPG